MWWPGPCIGQAGQEQRAPRARVDQFGDPLPNGAVARLGTTRWQLHESWLAFSPNGRYAIAAGHTTRLIDAVTGTVLRVFPTPSFAAFFTRDNKTVMLNALIWDISGLTSVPRIIHLADNELPGLWRQLSSADAKAAFQAVLQLAQASDQTLAYLDKQLHPASGNSAEKIRGLIAQLDSERFKERDRASQELLRMGDAAGIALVEARKNTPSAEAKLRIEALLTKLQDENVNPLSPEQLRECRAVEVLERIATPLSRRLLERLARGAPNALLTRQAEEAAKRLRRHHSKPPVP